MTNNRKSKVFIIKNNIIIKIIELISVFSGGFLLKKFTETEKGYFLAISLILLLITSLILGIDLLPISVKTLGDVTNNKKLIYQLLIMTIVSYISIILLFCAILFKSILLGILSVIGIVILIIISIKLDNNK